MKCFVVCKRLRIRNEFGINITVISAKKEDFSGDFGDIGKVQFWGCKRSQEALRNIT